MNRLQNVTSHICPAITSAVDCVAQLPVGGVSNPDNRMQVFTTAASWNDFPLPAA